MSSEPFVFVGPPAAPAQLGQAHAGAGRSRKGSAAADATQGDQGENGTCPRLLRARGSGSLATLRSKANALFWRPFSGPFGSATGRNKNRDPGWGSLILEA